MAHKILVGTIKGAFLLTKGGKTAAGEPVWSLSDPLFKGWSVGCACVGPDGRYYVGTANFVYGATIQVSEDLVNWRPVSKGPEYPDHEEPGSKSVQPSLTNIWKITTDGTWLYAGVSDAGLFRSSDGEIWEPLSGLNDHPTRNAWQPGFGGLCAHAILVDPTNRNRIWVGISAVGVFRSDDGGATWQAKNRGIPVIIEDEKHKEIGFCVHGLALDPFNPERIYRQDHLGMFVSDNAADSWVPFDDGLPANFGFPIEVDSQGRLYAFPQESDQYRMAPNGTLAVYTRSMDDSQWIISNSGLPTSNAYVSVLRNAMCADRSHYGTVVFGTTNGSVHLTEDSGGSWINLPDLLPRIQCVEALQ